MAFPPLSTRLSTPDLFSAESTDRSPHAGEKRSARGATRGRVPCASRASELTTGLSAGGRSSTIGHILAFKKKLVGFRRQVVGRQVVHQSPKGGTCRPATRRGGRTRSPRSSQLLGGVRLEMSTQMQQPKLGGRKFQPWTLLQRRLVGRAATSGVALAQ